jgi:hypothetical protein
MNVRCKVEGSSVMMDTSDFKAVLLKDKADKLETHATLDVDNDKQKELRRTLWAEIGCIGGIIDGLTKYEIQMRSAV